MPLPRLLRVPPAATVIAILLWMPAAGWAMAGMGQPPGQEPSAGQVLREPASVTEPCAPCLSCPVAPSPQAQSFNLPDGSSGDAGRLGHSADIGAPGLVTTDEPGARLPVRIAYCRWLN
jgi:hypothetical protein